MIEVKKCTEIVNQETQEVCGKACQPLPTSSNLSASEWYCKDCHKSYRMTEEVARELLTIEARNKR